ncbi:MAG: hypothetical protein HKM98_04740 [Gammaproteobacteria bacterium]|nr:hypothetical protein [Gammaproteobacteria bacterium]
MARAVFLALLAANLVFLGWQLVSADDRERRTGSSDAFDVPMLNIVDARESGSDDAERVAAVTLPQGADAVNCLSLGPFPYEDDFEAASLKLKALGLSGNKRLAEGQIWVGYWIFLSPADSRAEAVGKVEALREHGIRDIYIEPAGERENAVSLGVFKERNRAQRRYRQIRDLGFEPQIARRTRQGTVYWLDFVPDDSTPIDPADFQSSSGRIVRLASRVCQSGRDQIE